MLKTPLKKKLCCGKRKSFEIHDEYLNRIAKSLYYVYLPTFNCTSLPVTELAAEIFSEANKFSLNQLDIEKAAQYTRNGCISPCLFVLALLYLERLKTSNPKYLTKISPTELFLISVLVGSKFLQDRGEEEELENIDWAYLTGFTIEKINKMEKEFLDAINWNVYVSEPEFWKRFNLLELKVGMRQGYSRGWYTYTELNVLLQILDLSNLIQCLWNVTSACLLSYTTSVLALVGSSLLVSQIPGLKPKLKTPEIINYTCSSPSAAFDNTFFLTSATNQDCNYSYITDWATELNASEPEAFSKSIFYSEKYFNLTSAESSDDFNENSYWNYLNQFYKRPSLSTLSIHDFSLLPFNLMHIRRLDKSKLLTDWEWFFSENFNMHIWSNYIRTVLKRITISKSFNMVSNV